MSLDNLAPPGSSSYTSNTMHVGDGTWDKTTDTFLLPNLQGLNFATMRYNGMGNRFKDQPNYHTLILGHGVVAAIAFMFLMPVTNIMARYGEVWPGGRIAFKTHVYSQILVVFLSTVVLVLGWFAVGPARSLTNPHHGIGVAIYVLILFQFLYATCWFRKERRRTVAPVRLPITVFLHRLLGRTTALLAFIEVVLGLTLYGSPKYLFVLWSLVGAAYLVVYLVLTYLNLPHQDGSRPGRPGRSEMYSEYGSAISGSALPPPQRREHHWGRDLLAAGGMVGAYEWYKNKRDKRRDARSEKYGDGPDGRYGPPSAAGGPPFGPVPADGAHLGPSSVGPPPVAGAGGARRPISQSGVSRDSWEDDKYSERHARPTFGTRVMEATGAFAAYEGMRGFFNRRRRRNDEEHYEDGSYGSALGGNRPIHSDVSRVQAGDAPMSPDTPRVDLAGGPQPMTPTMTPSRPPRNATFAAAAMSDDSRDHYDPQRPRPLLEDGAPLSEHIRELGPIAGVREWNRQRKARREADRAENVRRQELENEENFNRRNSNHYPRPQDASNRRMSNSGTLMTGPSAPGASEMSRPNTTRPDTSHPPLPAEAGYSLPPPPPGPPPANVRSDGYGSQPTFGSAHMPSGAIDPDPARLLRDNTAANESSAYGRDPPFRDDIAGAAAAGAVGGIAAAALRDRSRGQSHSPTRGQDSRNRLQRGSRRGSATTASVSNGGPSSRPDNPNSPPVSVQVKMHNDGRHVTLRRLNDEEAAAGREARKQDRRRRRASSLSSEGEGAGPPLGQRYRRDGGGGTRNSSQQPITNIPPPPAMSSSAGASFRQQSQQTLPPAPSGPPQQSSPASNQALSPPTAPIAGSGMGYATETGTDVSAFADNRRRRRAERARRQEAAAANRGREFD